MQQQHDQNRSYAMCLHHVVRALALLFIAMLAASCGRAAGSLVFVDQAALAALDERARFGPFGIRRDYPTVALWIIIGAGTLLLVIGPRAIVDGLRWSRSGQFCAQLMSDLWARTPPGWAQAQRRFTAQLD